MARAGFSREPADDFGYIQLPARVRQLPDAVDVTHCTCAEQSLPAECHDRRLKVAFLQQLVVGVHLLELWRSWWRRK
jgi:hypothetical protein